MKSSRQRYREFVKDYKLRRLDEANEKVGKRADDAEKPAEESTSGKKWWRSGKQRAYVREYLKWLRPHRYAVGFVFLLALIVAGLQMVNPLFMRFIVDKVLLNPNLTSAERFMRLNIAGAVFLAVVILTNLADVLKDYRQRLLNVRVMLSLRRSLYERLLHLPLSKLWDMKTGGILSRITGDVDTTTGLLQMAVISPSVSVIRLLISFMILLRLNWRLALTARLCQASC
jgi:ATP-binding cassette subfamily B protein/subfamily B ATP-binding cassette protein MsbA